jgi:hypothetical protein
MSRISNKLLITTEKHEIIRVRQTGHMLIRGFCSVCKERVDLLTLEAAAMLCGLTGRELICRIGSDAVHTVDAPDDPLFVCTRSLQGEL